MMKKSKVSVMFLSIALVAVILSPMINTAKAGLESFVWLPPYIIRDYESRFYDAWIVGYEEDTDVTVNVLIENDIGGWDFMNITAVIINFDWNENYSATISPSPYKLPHDESHWFTVTFTAPLVSEVSNLYPHIYTVIIEHVDGGGDPLTPWVYDWWMISSYQFALYSHNQANATDLTTKYNKYETIYPPGDISDGEAKILATQASIEASLGNIYYERGDFATAKSQYETAIDLYDQAITKDGAWTKTFQEAQLNVTQTEANAAMRYADAAMRQADAAMKQAEAVLNQSYAYILFGLGFIIIGVGIVIYAAKKPKPP